MSNYFYNSPWQDANQYGAAAGNTLADSIYGIPRQRYEMALQQRQMQNVMQNNLMKNQIQQLRFGDLAQYHNSIAGTRQQVADNQNSNAQVLNQVRLLQAQLGYNKPLIVPPGASVMQRTQNSLDTSGSGGVNSNTVDNPTATGMSQPVTPSGQNSLQGYTTMTAPPRPPVPATGGQSQANLTAMMKLYAQALSSTNLQSADPKFTGMLSNSIYGAPNPYTAPVAQTGAMAPNMNQLPPSTAPQTNGMRVLRYNPATGTMQ